MSHQQRSRVQHWEEADQNRSSSKTEELRFLNQLQLIEIIPNLNIQIWGFSWGEHDIQMSWYSSYDLTGEQITSKNMDVWAVYRIRIIPTRPRKDDIYQQNSKCLKGHRTKISTAVTETLMSLSHVLDSSHGNSFFSYCCEIVHRNCIKV